ncbi:acetyl-CoA carboxylase biotin carboxylase subunit family protein [Kitasatospora sp. NRRL B-11411]|uniref:ATP-grasp domain-containing protein n=1 Tax=Kitasatospora sp. NRRL B-11411 TaxID=1463822 RepID=UPI0004C2E355|nr:ATP-grasp domain-containing protein [Kitasatospora sp. NRRL B-11411]
MHVLVLSTGNPLLENALLTAGHTVTVLQPAGTAALPGIEQHTVEHWDDLDALTALEPGLPDVAAIATIDEQAIVAAAHLRQLRGLPGLTVEAATAYTDKAVMKTTLAAAGLLVARHWVVHHAREVASAAGELGWPVLVKPRGGLATLNTFVVRDREHLKELVDAGAFDARITDPTGRLTAGHVLDSLHGARDGFLVEQFLDVEAEFFCDLYVHRGTVLLAVPGRYNAPLLQSLGAASFDTALPPQHPEARQVADLAARAAAALGAQSGVVHCEILRDRTGGLFVGEAGARPGGGSITELASVMYAFDLPATLAALATDQAPDLDGTPRFPALTAVMITAPAGTVTHVPDRDPIEALPGVLHADIRLTVGQPVPTGIGTMTLAGRVLYVPDDLDTLDQEVADLRAALDIRVEPLTTD